MPPTDDRYLEYTFEELAVEYLEDAIHSGQLKEGFQGVIVEDHKLPDGTPVFRTGDPVIDKWEEEFAQKALREIQEERRKGIVKKHISSVPRDQPGGPVVDWDLEDYLR